ncbi:hypothetical protein LMG8526HA_02280 [Lactococcus lactis]|nr:hypothetical protein [Lactococcus lactis]
MSYFSANTDKLTMVLLGVALTLGSVSDPLITEHYVQGNRRELATLVGYNFQYTWGRWFYASGRDWNVTID